MGRKPSRWRDGVWWLIELFDLALFVLVLWAIHDLGVWWQVLVVVTGAVRMGVKAAQVKYEQEKGYRA